MFENYDDIVTFNEFVKMIRQGRNKAYMLLKSKKVVGFKEGHDWRIPKKNVIAYVENCISTQMF